MQNPHRCVTQGFAFTATTLRLFWGPFDPDDRVDSLAIMIASDVALSAINQDTLLEIKAFTGNPAAYDAAMFAAEGFDLLGGDPPAGAGIPLAGTGGVVAAAFAAVGVFPVTLIVPVHWLATEAERYMGIQMTPDGGLNVHGFAGLIMSTWRSRPRPVEKATAL